MKVYQAYVLSELLGSETWTLYARQERRLNTFHLRCYSWASHDQTVFRTRISRHKQASQAWLHFSLSGPSADSAM